MAELQKLEDQLRAFEAELQANLQAERELISSPDDDSRACVIKIKFLIDRLRPLLWIYLRRIGATSLLAESEEFPTYIRELMATTGLEPLTGARSKKNHTR